MFADVGMERSKVFGAKGVAGDTLSKKFQRPVFPSEALILVVVIADLVDNGIDGDGVAGFQDAGSSKLVIAGGGLQKQIEGFGIASGFLEKEAVGMEQGGIVARRGA